MPLPLTLIPPAPAPVVGFTSPHDGGKGGLYKLRLVRQDRITPHEVLIENLNQRPAEMGLEFKKREKREREGGS